jgi:aspartyl aminopeptidase
MWFGMNREDFVQGLLHYIDSSPTPFHAVAQATAELDNSGFARLDEVSAWDLSSTDRFYVTRGDSSLIAIVVGQKPPQDGGLRIVAAHTDSPNLRVKPLPARRQHGYQQLGD